MASLGGAAAPPAPLSKQSTSIPHVRPSAARSGIFPSLTKHKEDRSLITATYSPGDNKSAFTQAHVSMMKLKPKSKEMDTDLYTVECAAPLPLHIDQGKTIELNGDEWRDIMLQCGYVVPEKKPAKPPILNFKLSDDRVAL